MPGTYFLEFNPGSANRPGTRLAGEVLAADWIIQNRYYQWAAERDRDMRRGDGAAQNNVDTHFRAATEIGAYRVLRNVGKAPR